MFRAPRPLALLAFLPILVASPAPAPASPLPTLDNCYAEMPGYAGAGEVVLMVMPDGSGPPFAEARERHTGSIVDARVSLHMIDDDMVPIARYPWEDVWLAPGYAEGTFGSCEREGTWWVHPEEESDAAGLMSFTVPPRAGGWNAYPVMAYVNGEVIQPYLGLPLRFVSPDINGDLTVNLSDVGFFADDLFGDYHVRSDMNGDGILNLSDSGFLATAIGRSCP